MVAESDKDKEEKAIGTKLQEIEKVKSVSVNSSEEDELDSTKEKIRINSIEILINIVTLTPSIYHFNYNYINSVFIKQLIN